MSMVRYGKAGPGVPASTRSALVLFGLWLLAFLLKHAGSAWDVAWHFRYPFGVFEAPHLVNISGSAIAAALIVFHTLTGKCTDRAGLMVMQGGFALFLLSVLLDALNHLLFGLDVTVWSPSHLLTFAATTILLLGVIWSLMRVLPAGRWRLAFGLAFWALLLDDALFQLSQQEYGVIAIDAYLRGQSRASAELLALAGRNPVAFVEGGIPHWVYPLWLAAAGTLALATARPALGWRWAATATALIYLLGRACVYAALALTEFPLSFIPAMLLPAAVLIDVAGQRHWRPLAAALALTACLYGGALLVGSLTLMPRFALGTAPLAFALLWAGYAAAPRLAQWRARQHAIPAL